VSRVLVTGAAGFAGRHLVAHLRARGDDVVAAGHGAEVSIDFRMAGDVAALVAEVAPDIVYHLAGTSSLAEMLRDPAGGHYNIVQPAVHVLEAAATRAPATRVLLVSTCHVYGRAARLPTDEACPLHPTDLYGAARAAVEYITDNYRQRGVPIVVARAFHHTGPGQDRRFALGDWAARGGGEVTVGNLEVRRDYSDVRDVVAGYRLLAEVGVPGEAYNLCSGAARSMRALFGLLLGPDARPVEDPARVRTNEVPVFLGSPARAEALGWRRAFSIERTLADLKASAAR
jgi:GDP-4-dehydro-6-deoxy-D-mannose reductase